MVGGVTTADEARQRHRLLVTIVVITLGQPICAIVCYKTDYIFDIAELTKSTVNDTNSDGCYAVVRFGGWRKWNAQYDFAGSSINRSGCVMLPTTQVIGSNGCVFLDLILYGYACCCTSDLCNDPVNLLVQYRNALTKNKNQVCSHNIEGTHPQDCSYSVITRQRNNDPVNATMCINTFDNATTVTTFGCDIGRHCENRMEGECFKNGTRTICCCTGLMCNIPANNSYMDAQCRSNQDNITNGREGCPVTTPITTEAQKTTTTTTHHSATTQLYTNQSTNAVIATTEYFTMKSQTNSTVAETTETTDEATTSADKDETLIHMVIIGGAVVIVIIGLLIMAGLGVLWVHLNRKLQRQAETTSLPSKHQGKQTAGLDGGKSGGVLSPTDERSSSLDADVEPTDPLKTNDPTTEETTTEQSTTMGGRVELPSESTAAATNVTKLEVNTDTTDHTLL